MDQATFEAVKTCGLLKAGQKVIITCKFSSHPTKYVGIVSEQRSHETVCLNINSSVTTTIHRDTISGISISRNNERIGIFPIKHRAAKKMAAQAL
jgi:hypothetical protein